MGDLVVGSEHWKLGLQGDCAADRFPVEAVTAARVVQSALRPRVLAKNLSDLDQLGARFKVVVLHRVY